MRALSVTSAAVFGLLTACAASAPGPEVETPLTSLCGGTITPTVSGTGETTERYYTAEVVREGLNYSIIANGWGPKFVSQTMSWNGTSFTLESMEGSQGDNWEPAGYPAVFCGAYSSEKSGECGLPAAIDSITTLKSGWIWKANGNKSQYNASYDIWVGNGPSISSHSGFLMVWLRDPGGQQPMGNRVKQAVKVPNVPGIWDVWSGKNGSKPCISYVRVEGWDSSQIDFDVMDFWRDLSTQGLTLNATHILSVAAGYEIWSGPIKNLETTDFCVKVN